VQEEVTAQKYWIASHDEGMSFKAVENEFG